MEMRRKTEPLRPVFQGDDDNIGTDMDRTRTYDFPLTFHSNCGPV